MNLRCMHCRYWDNSVVLGDKPPDALGGICRREAPRFNEITGGAMWPFTKNTDWCGELHTISHPNGFPMWESDGTMLDENGKRSVFDDVDE
jgi:hypothetical protein